jgi:hypothetical protein
MPTAVVSVSAELKSSIITLIESQEEDGSISSDPIITAAALAAFSAAQKTIKNPKLDSATGRAYSFLSSWLANTASSNAGRAEIYANLDILSGQVGSAIFAVWAYTPITDENSKKSFQALFTLLLNSCSRYLATIGNPVAVARLLYGLVAFPDIDPSFQKVVDDLTDYAMNELVADQPANTNRWPVLEVMTELSKHSNAKQLLQASWERINTKVPSKNLPTDLQTVLVNSTSALTRQILNKSGDDLSTAYAFRLLTLLDRDDHLLLQDKLYEKLSAFTLPKVSADEDSVMQNVRINLVSAILAQSLADSVFAKVLIFRNKDEPVVTDALSVYEMQRKQNLIPLSKRQYMASILLITLAMVFFLSPALVPSLLSATFYTELGLFVTIGAGAYQIMQWIFNRQKPLK